MKSSVPQQNTHKEQNQNSSLAIDQLDQSKQINVISIDRLNPHPDNPRKHSPAQIKQIAKSIQTFGFRFPVLIDQDNRIIAGHGRVMACEQLGVQSVPTLCVDNLSDEKLRALMIADNKLTENSAWDDDMLAHNFKILSDHQINLDFEIEVTGFDYGQIEGLMMTVEGEANDDIEINEEEDGSEWIGQIADIEKDSDPATQYPPVCQLGDSWLLGNHRLICGDATNVDIYKKLLGRKKANMIMTDPPYNLSAKDIGKVAQRVHGDFHEAAGEMTETGFTDFLSRLFENFCHYSKSGSIHYVFMDWRHLGEILTAGKQHYTDLKNVCVWAKDRAGMGTFYRSQHEMVLVFKNGNIQHQNNFKLGQYGRNRSNIWSYPSVRSSNTDETELTDQSALEAHPTIKPVRMIKDGILDCSKRGDIILDSFLGSGTTLLAAEQSHRCCMGIEIEPRYMDIAIQRWQALTGHDAIHQATGACFNEINQSRQLNHIRTESSSLNDSNQSFSTP